MFQMRRKQGGWMDDSLSLYLSPEDGLFCTLLPGPMLFSFVFA